MALTSEELKQQAKAQGRKFWADLGQLMTSRPDPERPIRKRLFLAGAVFAFLPLAALIGFRYAYNRLDLLSKGKAPTLHGQPPAVYAAMVAAPLVIVLLLLVAGVIVATAAATRQQWLIGLGGWMLANLVISVFVMLWFKAWQGKIQNYFNEKQRHGSARFATDEELEPYTKPTGFYIGGGYHYDKAGHLLTVGSTRSGKGTTLIIPNLTRMGGFKGSWVVIDPKGENAAVTAKAQAAMGRQVVTLNPWDLLSLGTSAFNPLDLLEPDSPNLSDDVAMIAETIVPMSMAKGKDDHFNDRARSVITGLLVHLATSPAHASERNLSTLWRWLRLTAPDWDSLMQAMGKNDHPVGGDIARTTAFDCVTMAERSEREFGSIMSTCNKWTDYLKSPALQRDLSSGGSFKPSDLTDGNTIVYVIIPADRLKTHAQWLRLVVSTLLRAVVRKPNKDVCFLLDEFYALGYLSEVETALGAYAGYGVHLWPILQNLVQLRDVYGDNWENFISSCSVRQFLTMSDNTTAEYVSTMFGSMSVPTYDALGNVNGATGRPLVSADELRRASGGTIFAVVDQLPPAGLRKVAYFDVLTEGKDYDPNPYQLRGA